MFHSIEYWHLSNFLGTGSNLDWDIDFGILPHFSETANWIYQILYEI